MENFNTVKKRLQALEQRIKELDAEQTNITSQITAVNDEWRPMLDSLVEKINSNFSRYFSKMRCVGEVSLAIPDNPVRFYKF